MQLTAGGSKQPNSFKGLFSRVIPGSTFEDRNVSPVWLLQSPASNTPPGSYFLRFLQQ